MKLNVINLKTSWAEQGDTQVFLQFSHKLGGTCTNTKLNENVLPNPKKEKCQTYGEASTVWRCGIKRNAWGLQKVEEELKLKDFKWLKRRE